VNNRFAHVLDLGDVVDLASFLFTDFALRTCKVILATVEVTGSRRIPLPRLLVLAQRTLLQKNLAPAVEYQDVNRAVHQPTGVNFATGFDGDNIVVLVDDVE